VSSGTSIPTGSHLMQFAHVEQGGSPGASRLAATGRSLQAWHDLSAEGVRD
jgi:hypothetical protein